MVGNFLENTLLHVDDQNILTNSKDSPEAETFAMRKIVLW